MADIRIKDLEKKTSVSSGDIMVTDGSDGTRGITVNNFAKSVDLSGNTAVTALQSSVSGIKTDVATAQTDITSLKSDMTTAESNIITAQSNITALQTKESTAESNIKTLQTRMTTAESNIKTLQTDVEGLKNITSLLEIHRIVQAGLASQVFTEGDEINIDWTDKSTGTTYSVPHHVLGFRDVTLSNGNTVPGMYIQWHYTSPFGVQFDQNEAFYYCSSALAAGTYNVTIGNTWGTITSGKSYQFTTTKALPAGGQLVFGNAGSDTSNMPDTQPSTWRVRTYEKSADTTPVEVLTLSEGTSGTNLGTLATGTKFSTSGMNNMQRAGYGYNRWSQSALRQYLNSSAEKGSWWTAQNVFDRPPAELSTKAGFSSGYSDEFLSIIRPVRVRTLLNSLSDSDIGTYEDTYDRFFLLSKEEMYLTPQMSGVEGEALEYWKRASGRTTPVPDYTTGAAPITYAINGKTNPQSVRLRSANRRAACDTWAAYASGGVSGGTASYSLRFAPACVIC